MPQTSHPIFPAPGGGETAEFFRSIDWSQHELGPTETWPAELKITLNILFHSRFPMVLFWGEHHHQFYNDAFVPSIASDKHPQAMGRRAEEVWAEVWPTIKPHIDLAMSGEGASWHENQLVPILRDGKMTDVYWTYSHSPVFDENGRVCGVFLALVETTQTVLLAKNLTDASIAAETERAKFEAAFQAVADGVFIFDSNGEPVFMNDSAARVFGSDSAKDLMERVEFYFERLELREMDGTFIPVSHWPITRALRGEAFRDWRIQAYRTDIKRHWVWSSSGELAKKPGSDVLMGVVVLRDITEQSRNEKDLIQAKHEAENANIAKSAFLANMSHEIRTPLGAILGFTELMRESTSAEERADFSEIIGRNGKALTKIIDDILDLSKVEAGRLEVEKIAFDLEMLLREVMDLFSDPVERKGLKLRLELPTEIPRHVMSDPTRIRQILINLVGNAVKFTNRGSVTIQVEPQFGSARTGEKRITHLKFSIIDTGVGLSTDQSERLFEPFSQADHTTTRKFGGSGLGLALSKRLAHALGGDAWIEKSAPGEGSTFAATVSARPTLESITKLNRAKTFTGNANALDHRKNLRGIRVLLIEDSADNQELVKMVLSKAGADIDIANNGVEGIERALESDYDVVLMDMQMPVLDGYQATARLRAMGYARPIVALTAHAMSEERKRTQIAGCNAHLTKPLDFELLTKTVRRFADGVH